MDRCLAHAAIKSTLEAMADAVENAAAVIMGLSSKYKQSVNCRLEAN